MESFDQLELALSHLALSLPRVGAALLIAPLLSQDTVPAMVRNVFIVGVALTVYPFIAGDVALARSGGILLLPLILKELFIGAVIGFSFGIAFWALGSAGDMIDNKIGATAAQATDPMSGTNAAEFGNLLARFAGFLFAALGGVRVFLDLVLSSYQLWPVSGAWPKLEVAGSLFFVERGSDLLRLALLLAAPAWIVMMLAEVALGLINRYAHELNVYALSMAVKGWLAAGVLLLMAGTMAETIAEWIGNQRSLLEALGGALPRR